MVEQDDKICSWMDVDSHVTVKHQHLQVFSMSINSCFSIKHDALTCSSIHSNENKNLDTN